MISPWFAEALDRFVREVYEQTGRLGALRLEVDADFGASLLGVAPGQSAEIATSCGAVTVRSRAREKITCPLCGRSAEKVLICGMPVVACPCVSPSRAYTISETWRREHLGKWSCSSDPFGVWADERPPRRDDFADALRYADAKSRGPIAFRVVKQDPPGVAASAADPGDEDDA